jgi:hypothetical protein
VLHLFGDHRESVGQDFAMDIADFFDHNSFPKGSAETGRAAALNIVTQATPSREPHINH